MRTRWEWNFGVPRREEIRRSETSATGGACVDAAMAEGTR